MYCHSRCLKAGFQKNGTQKFLCKGCKKYQQSEYTSGAYHPQSNNQIVSLLKEGIGLRSMSRVLRISLKTIITRIKRIALATRKPLCYLKNRVYQIDELWSFVRKKSNEVWIMYVLDRKNKTVLDFKVGPRTKMNLQSLTDQALLLEPQKICTDGLNTYRSLLPPKIHRVGTTIQDTSSDTT